MTPVVVSGIGVVAPAGRTVEAFWDRLNAGENAFAPARSWPASRVAEMDAVLPTEALGIAYPASCDRHVVLAILAARAACADAGLAKGDVKPERIAVITGTGGAGLSSVEEQFERLFARNIPRAHPFTIVRAMASTSASWISIAYGATGPCFAVSSACASGTHAIGIATQLIRAGIVDVAITCGAEAPLNQGTLLAWESMKILSRTQCRPFSRNRDGLMLSEGAAALVLESHAHAVARGCRPDIEIAGYACSSDAHEIVAPSAAGMAQAMRGALADARLEPSGIDYVNAHGTGTRANDMTEYAALADVFGADRIPPTSSTKGITGHALGAAGALEAVATIEAMRRSCAPPTAHLDEPDPALPFDAIPNIPRAMPIAHALSNSFAFGGLNACLVFRRL